MVYTTIVDDAHDDVRSTTMARRSCIVARHQHCTHNNKQQSTFPIDMRQMDDAVVADVDVTSSDHGLSSRLNERR